MCPATPSSKPYFPNMRKAAASRPLRYSRSSYLSVNVGGPGNFAICPLAWDSLKPGSRGALVEGREPLVLLSVIVADGGAMMSGSGQMRKRNKCKDTEVRVSAFIDWESKGGHAGSVSSARVAEDCTSDQCLYLSGRCEELFSDAEIRLYWSISQEWMD